MSLAELDGSGDAGATDALLQVEQAVREQTLQQVRISPGRSSCWCPSAWPSVGPSPAASCGPSARSPASRGRSRRPTVATDPARRSLRRDARPRRHLRRDARPARSGVRTQRRFVEDASHELRNPLAVIRTTSMSRSRSPTTPRPAPRRRGGTADCRPMSTTVDELMALARTSAQPERRVPSTWPKWWLTSPRSTTRRPRLAASGCPGSPLRPGRRRGPVRTEARPGEPRLERAPRGPPGSVVHCRAGRAGGWLWFGVRDVGRGIAPDDQALVFRRAWRDGAPTAEGDGRARVWPSFARSPRHTAARSAWPRSPGTAQASSCGCRTDGQVRTRPGAELRAMADPLWTVDAAS